ncbi:hypothetical protein [Streptomyces sp. NPDC058545]|uniref:hypothetical protein n=1 Tax=Streptomyces sp. NPDC058545 TaxID=3346544 RepID=UPI00364F9AD4
MPPSSDTFGRQEKKSQIKSGRKRGRQPGADGSALTMVEKPDVTAPDLPLLRSEPARARNACLCVRGLAVVLDRVVGGAVPPVGHPERPSTRWLR